VYTGYAPGFDKKVVIKDMTILNANSVGDWRKEVQTMAYVGEGGRRGDEGGRGRRRREEKRKGRRDESEDEEGGREGR
jgi:hypothetical protein